MEKNKKWMWKCTCEGEGLYEKSEVAFGSKEECYNDMRRAVFEKMKWNTNLDDFDFGDSMDADNFIGYQVKFRPMEIVHTSYSGTYIYTMEEFKEEEILRLRTDVLFVGKNKEEIKHYEAEFIAYMQNCANDYALSHTANVKNVDARNDGYLPLC